MSSLSQYLSSIVVATVVGSGMMSGLLFAFSNFVMRALLQLNSTSGMEAMQKINITIVNPAFLIVFLGTTILCILVIALAIPVRTHPGIAWLLLGSLCFLIGPFGITVAFNVPLNDTLASTQLSAATEIWPEWVQRWQAWNHTRTLLSVASTGLLAYGLSILEIPNR